MKYIELASVSILLGFIFSYIIGKILVPIFRKIKASQIINEYLVRHSTKKNTPTMGGLIFTFSTLSILFILLLMKKITMSSNLLIVIFIFSFYAVIGFIDDYLIIKRKTNKGLTENQKLFLQTIAAVIFFYLFLVTGNEPLLWIHTLNLRVDIGFFYGIFILLVLLAGSNAVNLTDGLDGLAGGLSLIAFFTFGIISFETNWLLGYEEIGVFCFILVGSLIGFLVFNLNPAKIFMGDTGSLSLGATLSAVAILTRQELLLILIGFMFVIETISVILQVIYYKLTHKRLFKMAPLHHHFEDKYKEENIVKTFWLIGLLTSLLALIFFYIGG